MNIFQIQTVAAIENKSLTLEDFINLSFLTEEVAQQKHRSLRCISIYQGNIYYHEKMYLYHRMPRYDHCTASAIAYKGPVRKSSILTNAQAQ